MAPGRPVAQGAAGSRTAVRLGLLALVLAGALAVPVACGWPSYAVSSDAPDTGVPPTEVGSDVTPYETASGVCSEGGVAVGAGAPCACGDAAADAEEGGPRGLVACTVDGGMAPTCVGCPGDVECDKVTVESGMTCIAGGLVRLGVANAAVCPPGGCSVELPEHTVAVSRFQLDEQEVTVRRFRDWWKGGHAPPSPGSVLFTAGDGTTVKWDATWAIAQPPITDATNGSTWLGETATKNDALPINYVDWPTAAAFCFAQGRRLPTEAEWEAAASGRNGRLFPFAGPNSKKDAPSAGMLPCDKVISAVAKCGAPTGIPPIGGQSPDGAKDLSGSLAEWVLDVQPAGGAGCVSCYPDFATVDPVVFVGGVEGHVVRGGHFQDAEPARLRAQARDFVAASTKKATIGFRCAK